MLYELLTGKQAFHGEDITEILAAVVRAEPDWSATARKQLLPPSAHCCAVACGKTSVSVSQTQLTSGLKLKMRLRHRKIPVPRRLLQLPRASCSLAVAAALAISRSSRVWLVAGNAAC